MRTQVAIVGGGPSGLLLSLLLAKAGIASVVLERRSRAHVMSRIRAGVLEAGTVRTLLEAGLGGRLAREGLEHRGCHFAAAGTSFRVDFEARCGRRVVVYGQTEVTKDLYAAHEALGTPILDEAEDVKPRDLDTAAPFVTFVRGGRTHRLDCDVVVGCDGYYGVCRQAIPASVRREFERAYPFGWLGVLSETPPADEELIYANHPDGFALASMRGPQLSRYYVQVPADTDPEAWSDDAFWDALRRRLPAAAAEALVTGPSVEKSVARLRSFVCEPMRWGRLLLVGDAAHIVPPTGAKGLNLAVSDVRYAFEAIGEHLSTGDPAALDGYSERALARVWKAIRFSWWMTNVLHCFPEQSAFDQRVQQSELAYLAGSERAQAVLAENYTGLPY